MTGEADAADVYVAGDSGKVYYSFEDGEEGTWDSTTPGSGSNVNAIDFHDDRAGHAVDGNKRVSVTNDGSTWEKLGIGGTDYNPYGVDSDAPDDIRVSGSGGSVYRWNGSEWLREDTGDADLRDLGVADDDGAGLTVGGCGAVFDRSAGTRTVVETPIGQNLKALLRGETDVAVGAGGTIIEW